MEEQGADETTRTLIQKGIPFAVPGSLRGEHRRVA
jgi:hypothetical protein